ncbi:hypothetical protein GGI25_005993 [Coemansia spiralis]|uniref:Uncharacterized protein n=2 Tax=Coemansia TaxID=4863 RepID=A0A9W8G3H4_9FUNG|nr:hypothetical protein EDC05_001709 [Coemansia umbellata]KAJ2621043.1 hypothetical protein GGI26_004455 [Coemansia sp. RSA 1358]KAJ2669919.1 hypothetical protein GGI25_005993 [Coemansia spiralis]
MQLKIGALFAGAVTLLFASVVAAEPISDTANLIVLGDSLSDNGNTAALLKSEAYWDGRYTNGYVWNEYTSRLLGMSLINMAYANASSNNDITFMSSDGITIPSLHDQVHMLLAKYPSPNQFHLDNDAIQIGIGSNDLFEHAVGLLAGTVNLQDLAIRIAQSISTDIQLLINVGYKNIDLWSVPPLDKTPKVIALSASAYVKPMVERVNSIISQYVGEVISNNSAKTQSVHIFDLYSLVNNCLEPQVLAALDISDYKDACYNTVNNTVSICHNPDQYFFYDDVHPSSRVHYLWGVSAAVLTRDSTSSLTASELLNLIYKFNIGQSSRDKNIIVYAITASESAAIPPSLTATETVSTSTPVSTTVYVNKCH